MSTLRKVKRNDATACARLVGLRERGQWWMVFTFYFYFIYFLFLVFREIRRCGKQLEGLGPSFCFSELLLQIEMMRFVPRI